MKKRTEIIIHILFWLFYITNVILSYQSQNINEVDITKVAIEQLSFFIIIIFLFYFNYIFLIPRYLSNKKYIKYFSGLLILLLWTFFLYILQFDFLDWIFKTSNFYLTGRINKLPYLLFQAMFYLVVSTGTKFTLDWFKNQKLKEELEKEKNLSELLLLKHQISPHFLFNTLNNLYSLVSKKSEEAPEAVLMLSDLMRYTLKEASKEKIELAKEISYLHSFIELQKLRMSNPKSVIFKTDIDNPMVEIAPMLLVSFIENAFKHANITSENSIIETKINLKKYLLRFSVVNEIKQRNKDDTSGIGLKNVQRRLKLLYPQKSKLEITNKNGIFKINLEIMLK